jgi:hypothetical protein
VLPALPSKLKIIRRNIESIKNFYSIFIKLLPAELIELQIPWIEFSSIHKLPSTIEILKIINPFNLNENISLLPINLKILELSCINDINNFDLLPLKLNTLSLHSSNIDNIYWCSRLTNLKVLKLIENKLISLNCKDENNNIITYLPLSLQKLTLFCSTHNDKFSWKFIPSNINYLSIESKAISWNNNFKFTKLHSLALKKIISTKDNNYDEIDLSSLRSFKYVYGSDNTFFNINIIEKLDNNLLYLHTGFFDKMTRLPKNIKEWKVEYLATAFDYSLGELFTNITTLVNNLVDSTEHYSLLLKFPLLLIVQYQDADFRNEFKLMKNKLSNKVKVDILN